MPYSLKLSYIVLGFSSLISCQNAEPNTAQLPNKERELEMWEEPRHQLVFSKDHLKVVDVRIPPNDTTEFHWHRSATIYVVIDGAQLSMQNQGEEMRASPSGVRLKRGEILDASEAYLSKATLHRVCNPDTTTFHLLGILNANEPAETGSDTASATLDNGWFKEHRLVLGPGEESEVLLFPNPTVLVQCGDGESALRQSIVVHSTKTKAGAFSWHDRNTPLAVVNKSENELEFLLIEIKE